VSFLVRVQSDAPAVARAFGHFAEREYRWASTLGLTRTAVRSRDAVRGEMPNRFTLRNRRSQAGVQAKPADVRAWPTPFSMVGHRDPWFVRQEIGGIKRPEKGASNVAIPSKLVRRGSSGAVPKSQKPRQLRDKKTVFVANGRIQQRVERRKGLLARLQTATWWLLRREVRIRPRFRLRETVEQTAARVYQNEFELALNAAVAKARKKAGHFLMPAGAIPGDARGPIGPSLPELRAD
jgi:hypothetical protein